MMVLSPLAPSFCLTCFLIEERDVLLRPEGVVVGCVVWGEARRIGREELLPDPREAKEPADDALEEGTWHPEEELLYRGEVRYPGEAQDVEEPLRRGEVVVDVGWSVLGYLGLWQGIYWCCGMGFLIEYTSMTESA
jgi:hypothetical protein